MPTTSALVIGGSLAGMCAARVLSDFVDRVTIIERDAYPAAHDFRPGVVSVRLFNWYRPKLVACPARQVGARLGEVTHLLRPMSSLLAPRVVARVLVAAMWRRIKTMAREASSDGLRPMPPGAE